jgi:hypothetical protein
MTRKTAAPRTKAERIDVYEEVTNQIIAMPEASRPRMRKPGRTGQGRARAKTAPAAT